jgi:hypothetical protein
MLQKGAIFAPGVLVSAGIWLASGDPEIFGARKPGDRIFHLWFLFLNFSTWGQVAK